MEELKTFDMTNPEEVKAFIKECFSLIPEHPVNAETQPDWNHEAEKRKLSNESNFNCEGCA